MSKQVLIRCSRKIYEESKRRKKIDVKQLSLFHHAALAYVESLELNMPSKETKNRGGGKDFLSNPFKIT